MAVKIHSEPAQLFSANFELRGSAQAGMLAFTTPLGSTLAQLRWDPAGAALLGAGAPQNFDSLASLTRQVAGTELPVEGLFAWLGGEARPVQGWQPDLGGVSDGRLVAHRLSPEPRVDLTIILAP
jgi:outer membrane lipoprotein LolB